MSTAFASLGLSAELLAALDRLDYREMTAIQQAALPPVLAGSDVLAQAKTGSGKTAAFGLGLLHRLDPTTLGAQALVLCPTRELADQVAGELRRLAQCTANVRITTVCGGRPFRAQRQALERGAHVVVGTPGRVADHLRKRSLNLDSLRVLVLDEADRMLDMGFADEVHEIVGHCPARQTLLFSATYPDGIAELSAGVQANPVRVTVDSRVAPTQLRQLVFECERAERWTCVARLLSAYTPDSALIFCETRNDCDQLAGFLNQRGATTLVLHGALEQRERDDVLVQFTNGSGRLLVATNVAARGLDIPALPAVIVAELSPDPESHVHRIGRTGRAGEPGLALSIVAGGPEPERLERIEAALGAPIERGPELPPATGLDAFAPTHRTLLLLSGRKDKLRKGDVLGALVKDGGIPSQAIGDIALSAKTCAIAIEAAHARRALKYFQRGRVKNKRVRAVLLGEP